MSAAPATPLRLWRERLGLSQRAAAEALGLALTSYQDQERGTNRRTGEPIRTPRTLLLACAALEAGLEPIAAEPEAAARASAAPQETGPRVGTADPGGAAPRGPAGGDHAATASRRQSAGA